MRTWVKRSLIGVAIVMTGFAILAGTTAFYAFRALDTRTATETESAGEFQAIRTKFGARPPLVEIVTPGRADLKINRSTEVDVRPVTTLHVVTWEADGNRLLKTEVPIWLMRFSSINVLSQLGVTPDRFKLTVQDIERYGPGVVIDHNQPGKSRVLIWVD
jgi:hypothetical protein